MMRLASGAALAAAVMSATTATDTLTATESIIDIEPVAVAENHHPTVGAKFPVVFFGKVDMFMGFLIGLYSPVQLRWRNYDCRGRAFSMGVGLLQYSKDFDQPSKGGFGAIFGFLFRASFSAFSIMNTLSTCKDQYITYIKNDSTPWTDAYDLASASRDEIGQHQLDGYWTHPRVMADEFGVGDVLTAGQIALKFLAIFSNYNTEYYYFFAGEALGSFIGNSVMSFDKWFDLGIVTPENTWDRYLDDGL